MPDDFICPITSEIMTDPVSTSDGFTYERAAITEWLRTKDTSPKTGATLESTTLYPNLSLRSVIRAFIEAGAARVVQQAREQARGGGGLAPAAWGRALRHLRQTR